MPVKEIGDPRLEALFGTSNPRDASVRPVVGVPGKGIPPVAIALGALALALVLFLLLNARRVQPSAPSVQPQVSDNAGSAWSAPPPLYVPPAPQTLELPAPAEEPRAAPAPIALSPAAPAPKPVVLAPPVVQTAPQPAPFPVPAAAPPQRIATGSPLVIDTGNSAGNRSTTVPVSGGVRSSGDEPAQPIMRMRASAFANRSMTVPQGYLIPAVLETAFDSTKPGFARAIVSRDVRGFDGKNVLIPRGSRLVGEYRSEPAQGQKRAIINWIRLIRPDGMTIAMDAPAVDTVGRGGVPASVNTHFFSRLGDALLQSTFAIGQALAGRAVTGPVVVVSGSGSPSTAQLTSSHSDYVPTLKVAPGKSISVFVAQDLDFSAVGAGA